MNNLSVDDRLSEPALNNPRWQARQFRVNCWLINSFSKAAWQPFPAVHDSSFRFPKIVDNLWSTVTGTVDAYAGEWILWCSLKAPKKNIHKFSKHKVISFLKATQQVQAASGLQAQQVKSKFIGARQPWWIEPWKFTWLESWDFGLCHVITLRLRLRNKINGIITSALQCSCAMWLFVWIFRTADTALMLLMITSENRKATKAVWSLALEKISG